MYFFKRARGFVDKIVEGWYHLLNYSWPRRRMGNEAIIRGLATNSRWRRSAKKWRRMIFGGLKTKMMRVKTCGKATSAIGKVQSHLYAKLARIGRVDREIRTRALFRLVFFHSGSAVMSFWHLTTDSSCHFVFDSESFTSLWLCSCYTITCWCNLSSFIRK